MTKKQLIEDIRRLNRSATVEFLEQFDENELDLYLRRLLKLVRKHGSENLLQPINYDDI